MLKLEPAIQPLPTRQLTTSIAREPSEVLEAQRLRYKVFAEEMGANIPGDEFDQDKYDAFCDHLIVRESEANRVIGTYRILPPDRVEECGGYYSQSEFDITRLLHLSDRMVEVGRSCVHRDFRDGSTIAQLWGGLARYMLQHRHEYLIGCASITMADGGHIAASLYQKLHRIHGAPTEYHVFPRCPLPLHALNSSLNVQPPPLLKGYLRLGAYICGEPAWDPEFNTADLLILLPIARMNTRYANHFLK